MTVFRDKRRNNRWSYEFEIDRQRYQGTCDNDDGTPSRTKDEAREAEVREKKLVRARQGMARSGIVAGGFLLTQALGLHLQALEADGSTSHLASVRRIAAEIVKFFGPTCRVVEIDQIRADEFRTFTVGQRRKVWIGGARKPTPEDEVNPALWKVLDRPISPSEVNHRLDVLRSALGRAHKVRDPLTGHSALPFPPDIKPVFEPKRTPTPMPEAELAARLESASPWTIEATLLARLFGCRLAEATFVDLRHMDHQERCLRFRGEETKSGRDEALYGGEAGWALLERLAAQAIRRGQTRLITWPGLGWARRVFRGVMPADDATDPETSLSIWRPLKSIRRSWNGSARRAGIDQPQRYHDVRAAYITDIDRVASATTTRLLARHASMATTQKYIGLVDSELAEAANVAAKRRAKMKIVK